MTHFGTLRNAYRLIGYTSRRDCEYLESREGWADINAKLAEDLSKVFTTAGYRVSFDPTIECLRVNGITNICLRVARWFAGKAETHTPHWAIRRKMHSPAGWIVALRLSEHNKSLLDYILLPTTQRTGLLIRFSERARSGRAIDRFENFEALTRALVRRATKARATRTAPAKLRQPRRKHPTAPSKGKAGRARH
jgi:hypothetical protein